MAKKKTSKRQPKAEATAANTPILVCAPRDGDFRYLMEFSYPNYISIQEVNADTANAATWKQAARTICSERRERFREVESICAALNRGMPLPSALADAADARESLAAAGEGGAK